MRDRRSTPLFDAVPSYLKLRDGQAQRALEALTALLTQELQVVERDVDQLYDNWFIISPTLTLTISGLHFQSDTITVFYMGAELASRTSCFTHLTYVRICYFFLLKC